MARIIRKLTAAVLGVCLSSAMAAISLADNAHEVTSLPYGEAIFNGLSKDTLQALIPLEVAQEKQGFMDKQGSPYPSLYHADLQYRFGLYTRAQAQFKRLSETLAGKGLDIDAQKLVLNDIWFRLGTLLYQDGRYPQSKNMLLKTSDSREDLRTYLIDDIQLRLGEPLLFEHESGGENAHYLRYRQLLSRPDFDQAWITFIKELDGTPSASKEFSFFKERVQLSAALKAFDSGIRPFDLAKNQHFLAPYVRAFIADSSRTDLPSKQTTARLYDSILELRQLVNAELTNKAAYEGYLGLHAQLQAEIQGHQPLTSAANFKTWFATQDFWQSSAVPALDWEPWLARESVQRQQESVRMLNDVQKSLDTWQWRFPFLQFVYDQHKQLYETTSENLDLTPFKERYHKAKQVTEKLQAQLSMAYPVDNSGILYDSVLRQHDARIRASLKNLKSLQTAQKLSDSQYQEKREILRRAQGRVIWEAQAQWSNRYRQVSKNLKIIQRALAQAQERMASVQVGAKQWQGEAFGERLRQLQGQLDQMLKKIEDRRQAALWTLEKSAYSYAQELQEKRVNLAQIALQNKLVFAQTLDMSAKELIADYELLLKGPLSLEDQAQAWLALGEHYFRLGEDDDGALETAITFYQKWLYESGLELAAQDRERVLYRIAQSHAVLTQQEKSVVILEKIREEFPTGQYIDEVLFRLAEDAYASANYARAKTFYQQQIEVRPESNLSLKSHYMLGWSEFKLGALEPALDEFLVVLEAKVDQSEQAVSTLREDARRISQLVLDRAGGVELLAKKFSAPLSEVGYQAYELYFDSLRSKALYFKLYESVESFQQRYPQHPKSPELSMEMVSLLNTHSFFDAQRDQQALFLDRYIEDKPASKYQSIGLEYAWSLGDYQRKRKGTSLEKAIYYYKLALTHWPKGQLEVNDLKAVDLYSRLADSYFDSEEYFKSLALYAAIAYPKGLPSTLPDSQTEGQEPQTNTTRSDLSLNGTASEQERAALAHLSALKRLNAAQPQDAESPFEIALQQSRVAFFSSFPDHKTAPVLRLEAAHFEAKHQRHESAIRLSQSLYDALPKSGKLSPFELSIIDLFAAASYNTHKFDQAADAYQLGLTTTRKPEWQERLGDSLFAASQNFASEKKYTRAVQRINRLFREVPKHRLVSAAAFDRGQYFEVLEMYEEAEQSWRGLLSAFPQSTLVDKTSLRLATLLERQSKFGPAATSLLTYQSTVERSAPIYDELTLKIADMYRQGKDAPRAITQYKRLANGNPTRDIWFVSVGHLIQMYDLESPSKANFWRQKAIGKGASQLKSLPGEAQTLVLASAVDLAAQSTQQFKALPLRPPFQETLPPKQKAMAAALKDYETLAEFGVSPYYEQSLHSLGELYVQFANELMDSERPAGLSELALEEYEILLEEQAYDFEEKGLNYYQRNLARLWDGEKNAYTLKSLGQLQEILASSYKRVEKVETSHVYPQ